MRRCLILLLGLAVVFSPGCARKQEITSLQRKQAANLVSEAQFAMTLREYARAEGLYAQATALCPDTPEYLLSLGAARRRLGNRDGAKAAYEQMLDLAKDHYKHDSKDPQPLLQQVYVLALLGRMDDARAAQERAQKNHPNDPNVRAFIGNRELERMPDSPGFKDVAL